MTGRLSCTPRSEPPLAVLRVDGVLSMATAPLLRNAMLKCLTDQPDAVVVEAESLVVADDAALTVLRVAARHAAAWPAVPVLVCTARARLRELMRAGGLNRRVALCTSLAEARAIAAGRPLPSQVRVRLQPVPTAVPEARALVTEACQRWRLRWLAAQAGLVISELVGNAVRHAGTPVEVWITHWERHLHVAVRDYAPGRPRLVGPDGEADPGGRGLLLVDAVASSWGYTETSDGKVSWASLSTQPPRRSHNVIRHPAAGSSDPG